MCFLCLMEFICELRLCLWWFNLFWWFCKNFVNLVVCCKWCCNVILVFMIWESFSWCGVFWCGVFWCCVLVWDFVLVSLVFKLVICWVVLFDFDFVIVFLLLRMGEWVFFSEVCVWLSCWWIWVDVEFLGFVRLLVVDVFMLFLDYVFDWIWIWCNFCWIEDGKF